MSVKEKLLTSAQKNLQKGQLAKAVKDYQKLLEVDPKDIRNRQKLAELLSRALMAEEALEQYETVARHYAETGFYLKAIAVYKQMQKLDPSRPEFCSRLAELNEKQGLNGNALAEYRNLAAYYEKNRMYSEETKVLQKMRELEPDNLNLRVKIVEINLQGGNEEQACRELQEILDSLAGDYGRLLKIRDFFQNKFPQNSALKRILEERDSEGIARTGTPEKSERGGSAPEKMPVAAPAPEIVAPFSEDDPQEIAELADELEEAEIETSGEGAVDEEPEEIPLEFLLGLESPPSAAGPEEEPAAEVLGGVELPQEPEAEIELELELDMGIADDAPVLTGDEPLAEPIEDEPLELSELEEDQAEEIIELEVEEEEAADLGTDLTALLEEVEFYLQQGLLADAERICRALLADHPGDVRVQEKLAAIEAQPHAEGAQKPLEDYFDLGAELAGLDSPDPAVESPLAAESTAAPGVKKRVKTEVEVEDPESHYNLGIAYKEMGLLDDAIGEFDKAMRDQTRAVACLILKGICLLEKGDLEKAEGAFKVGLARPQLVESERISLNYEMGELYEMWGRLGEALECFQYVADRDLFFRQAGERVASLRQRLGPEEGDNAGSSGKDRVSYV